jgi:hypothetical protein
VQGLADAGFARFSFINRGGTARHGEELFPDLAPMTKKRKIFKRYHAHGDLESLDSEVSANSIRKIIHPGFVSNICIFGRRVGMFGMYHRSVNAFLTPESSVTG